MLPHDGVGSGDRQTEEGQRALEDDDAGHVDEGEGEGDRGHVGQDLAEDDPPGGGPQWSGRDHEVAVGESQRRGADHPVEDGDGADPEDDGDA